MGFHSTTQASDMTVCLAALLLAHSWYPGSCCGERDCRPVPCSEIRQEGSNLVYGKMLFLPHMRQYSQDGPCHECCRFGIARPPHGAWPPPLPSLLPPPPPAR